MTIFNLGSINADHFYDVPRFPRPGETLAASGFATGLGGKGANQSVAAAHAGSKVVHMGAVGADGAWAIERLRGWGIDVSRVQTIEEPTGHAIIYVNADGENEIVIYSGANRRIGSGAVRDALGGAGRGDILLLQNETNLQKEAAAMAREKKMRIIYSAAPFSRQALKAILPFASIVIMNAVEFAQFCAGSGSEIQQYPLEGIIVTRGAEGADWIDPRSGEKEHMPAFPAEPVDTTAAGDTFAGYFAAGLDQGMTALESMRLASAAAALKITRPGTADAIPSREEVEAFVASMA